MLSGIRPRREIFAGKNYQNVTLVEFARGCNFKCDFCSITAFHDASQNHRPAGTCASPVPLLPAWSAPLRATSPAPTAIRILASSVRPR